MKKMGISLIVLVITILVLAILAATVIISLSNTNIMAQASNTVSADNLRAIEEAVNLKVATHMLYNRGNVDAESLLTELNEEFSSKGYTAEVNMETSGITMSNSTITVEVSSIGIVTASANVSPDTGVRANGKTALELFDANLGGAKEGYKANKLQIGDFVDYDAGNWGETVTLSILNPENTENAIAGAGYTGRFKPETGFGFGGFASGSSKNNNAVPFDSDWGYVQTTDNESVTGWRVFDVDETTGVVTLISAGCPEDYYVPSSTIADGNGAYISEYILVGTASMESYAQNYNVNFKPRDWSSEYARGKGATNNIEEVATSARLLTADDLTRWYTKYMNNGTYYVESSDGINYLLSNGSSSDGFGVINGTQYDNLVNTHAWSWLATAFSSSNFLSVYPQGRWVQKERHAVFGLRPLVYLASNILFENEGTKTLKDAYTEGNTYTYNVWSIVGKQQ